MNSTELIAKLRDNSGGHINGQYDRQAADTIERQAQLIKQLEAAGSELRASNERWGLTKRRRDALFAWNQAVVAADLDDEVSIPSQGVQP